MQSRKGKDGLTDKQRKFVFFKLQGKTGANAARLAGYKGSDEMLAVIASQNIRKPIIANALKNMELDLADLKDLAIEQFKIAALAETEDKWTKSHKLKGAEYLARVSGAFADEQRPQVAVQVNIDTKQMSEGDILAEIARLESLISSTATSEHNENIIDAEVTESDPL